MNATSYDNLNSINWEKASEIFQKDQIQSQPGHILPAAKDVLRVLACVGQIGMIFAFPKAASSIAPLLIGGQSYKPWATKKVLSQLEKRKYISIQYQGDGDVTVKITQAGMMRALTYKLETMRIVPKTWDGKWRVVIFDIPNTEKKLRDLFRMRLKQLSMYQLQESALCLRILVLMKLSFYGDYMELRSS